MKNDYKIIGDTTIVYLDRKDGTRLECLIDTEDLRKIDVGYKWYARESFGTIYVQTRIPNENGYREYIHMHRLVLGVKDNQLFVDHKDHNGLNNKKGNLREATRQENNQNKRSSYKNSKSGIRGVTRKNGRWRAQIRVNLVDMHIGMYDTIEEAEKAVIKARLEHMPFSQE